MTNLLEDEEETWQDREGEIPTQDSLALPSLLAAHQTNLSVSALTNLCLHKFTALLTALGSGAPGHRERMRPTALETEHERLRIWLGNLGALQTGRSSLDFRLRESTVILGNVVALLTDLDQALSKSIEVVSGARPPLESLPRPVYSSDESSDTGSEEGGEDQDMQSISELAQHLLSIRDILSDLFKLSFKIRNSSTRPKSLKPALYSEVDAETHVDKFEVYAELDRRHVEESFDQFERNAELIDPASQRRPARRDNNALLERLAHTITKRRRVVRYRQRHSQKLALELAADSGLQIAELVQARNADDSAGNPQSASETTKKIPYAAPSFAERSFFSQTDATQFDRKLDDSLDSESFISYASTTFDASGNAINLPAPPPKASEGTEFLCPYCGIVCPSRYAEGRTWRTHIVQDLQPYICTYAECQKSDEMYGTRHEWLEHERLQHRRVWQCFSHRNEMYRSEEQLRHHLESSHTSELTTSQIQSVLDVSEASRADDRSHCPICLLAGPFERGMENHVAFHLESFSAFSVSNGLAISDAAGSNCDDGSGIVQGLRSDLSQLTGSLNLESPRRLSTPPGSRSSMGEPEEPTSQPEPPSIYSSDELPRKPASRLKVSNTRPGIGAPQDIGALPPASPLLESYQGTWQSILDMASPMAHPIDVEPDDDDIDALEPLSPRDSGKEPQRGRSMLQRQSASRSDSREPKKPKKTISMYEAEGDAKDIAAELVRPNPNFRVLTDILPGLNHDQITELHAAYKHVAKVQGKGINISKHIKLKVPGVLGDIAYVTSLGQWQSEGYWANYWYQSSTSKRELVIESLMGRTNAEIRLIKDAFKDKRYGDSLVRCMGKELRADKFRTAIMMALEEKRQEENDVWPREYVDQDVDVWIRALRRREGGETALLEICVGRSERHLRECLKVYERREGGNFARLALERSGNLVGEVIAHILNGVINRPARDAMLLHHALDDLVVSNKRSKSDADESDNHPPSETTSELQFSDEGSVGESAQRKPNTKEGETHESMVRKDRYELLISRLVRLHWDSQHKRKVKDEYREKYGHHIEDDVEDTLEPSEFREFCLQLLESY